MRIEGNTVIFRSYPSMYEKEESGKKPNTVRILDSYEASQVFENWEKLKYIRIMEEGRHTRSRSFTRELTDITEVGELLGKEVFVFSWRHENAGD